MDKLPSRVKWVVMAALVIAACAPEDRTGSYGPERLPQRPNVIVVLVDAMRADHLGAYGYDRRPVSPRIDAFSRESIVFDNAVSQASWTVPSVASLFTGVYPQTHQVLRFIRPEDQGFSDSGKTEPVLMDAMSPAHDNLAEQFQRGGYATVALVKSRVVNAGRGYAQGFDSFEFVQAGPKAVPQADGESAKHLTDAALEFLAGHGRCCSSQPFFLYLHYMDTHVPYRPPEPYYSKYLDPAWMSEQDGGYLRVEPLNRAPNHVLGSPTPSPDDIEKLLALYDASIEYVDSQFGRILDYLDASGAAEETVVVLTADHGEAFYEHGQFFHAGLFQENIAVPLIFRIPGMPARRIADWVENMDLAATLVDVAGLERGNSWLSESLLDITDPQARRTSGVYSEVGNERTIIDQSGMKLMQMRSGTYLFDLTTDPQERNDLHEQKREIAASLERRLADRVRDAREAAADFPKVDAEELTPEQIKALKALGYIN